MVGASLNSPNAMTSASVVLPFYHWHLSQGPPAQASRMEGASVNGWLSEPLNTDSARGK